MRAIIFTLLIVASITAFSQQDAVKSMINRSEISIYKSQKQMISGNAQQKQQELSQAVKFQQLAVQEFKNNNMSLAICYTSKARQYTTDILSSSKLQGLDFYLLNNEEKSLIKENNCFEKDSDLQKAITPNVIEDDILMSPDKLSVSYKISIN